MLVVRLYEGLALAVVLPLCFVRIRRSDVATAALALIYAAYTVMPVYDRWQAWIAVLMCALCAPLLRRRLVGKRTRRTGEAQESVSVRQRAWRAVRGPVPLLLLPAVFGAASLGGAALWHTIWYQLRNNHLAITIDGACAAVFAGGLATGLILRQFSSVTAGRAQAVLGAGTLLGWLERTLYFAFLLAGQPTAAAFALTAKSAARFPALQREEEGLAEYYLIGSLSSLVVAVVTALLTRLALGMAAV